MRFNHKKLEDNVTDTIPLQQDLARASDQANAVVRISGPPARSVIDACLTITGNLQSERDVQVDGELNGDIHCAQLIVSRNAAVNGSIVAEEVIIRGKVKGVIRAGQVMLQDTAEVESEIFHRSLVIEEGAHFEGESRRVDEPANSAAAREGEPAAA